MNLTAEDVANTEALKESLRAKSKAEVVGTALAVMAYLNEILEEGGELLIRGKDGSLKKLRIALD
ncbi:MAG: hypothetical protein ACFCBW_12790 [Candidatus Competibacterales bacterium]